MPKLIRLYIQSIAIGFALSAVFLAMMLWQDVAGLRHLIFGSDMGWLAALMVIMFNGIVFSGAQFAIVIMRLAADDEGPRGGRRVRVTDDLVPVAQEAVARKGLVRPRR